MPRILLVGLAVIGIAACGGSKKPAARANTRTPASAPAASKPAESQATTSTAAKRKARAGADTTSRNPLTNR